MRTKFSTVGSDTADFAATAEARVPCVIICDTSGSMTGAPIIELNDGLQVLYEELGKDPIASVAVDVAVVTFGGTVEVAQPFATVESSFVPSLTANGDTPMGAGVSLALEILNEQKQYYNDHGIPRRRAWAFLISDGSPTDEWLTAAAQALNLQDRESLILYAIGVQGADMKMLARFSKTEPFALKGLHFAELFRWVSKSMSTASRRPNVDQSDVPPTNLWANE